MKTQETINELIETCQSTAKGKQEPLFLSYDGVEVFEGDDYLAIEPQTNEVVWSIADYNSPHSDWLQFAIKENAEMYIQNKA